MGRLMSTNAKIKDQDQITLNEMKLNELGKLITKCLRANQTSGSLSFIQKDNFTYNIRSRLTKINEPSLSSDHVLLGCNFYTIILPGWEVLLPIGTI
jgi:hypothetical protein